MDAARLRGRRHEGRSAFSNLAQIPRARTAPQGSFWRLTKRWTAPQQLQTLTGSSALTFGASGLAVAQGTHQGIVSGEFGGDAITAIQLPTAVDTTATPPAISDWVTCHIGGGFSNGYDPHTLTAYQSPNGAGDAIALQVNGGATTLARVDLTLMLALPQTITPHVCDAGTLPASVVSFLAVP